MEITVALLISILSITFSIIGFAFNRKDKSNSDVQNASYRWGQIDTKLKNIEAFMAKIEKKLDNFDEELDDRIAKAIEIHIKEYHHKGV